MARLSLDFTSRLFLAAAGFCALSVPAAAQELDAPVQREVTAAVGHALQADVGKALRFFAPCPKMAFHPSIGPSGPA